MTPCGRAPGFDVLGRACESTVIISPLGEFDGLQRPMKFTGPTATETRQGTRLSDWIPTQSTLPPQRWQSCSGTPQKRVQVPMIDIQDPASWLSFHGREARLLSKFLRSFMIIASFVTARPSSRQLPKLVGGTFLAPHGRMVTGRVDGWWAGVHRPDWRGPVRPLRRGRHVVAVNIGPRWVRTNICSMSPDLVQKYTPRLATRLCIVVVLTKMIGPRLYHFQPCLTKRL